MRRVRSPEPTLAAELQNIVENYEGVRDQVYRRYGVHKEAISLLRRALAASGQLSELEFARQTHIPADRVCRAAAFLSDDRRKWAKLEKRKNDLRYRYVVGTPAGVRALERLDAEVEKQFLDALKVMNNSKQAARIADLARALNQQLRDMIPRQQSLFPQEPNS